MEGPGPGTRAPLWYAARVKIDILIGSWERFEPLPGQGYHFALVDIAEVWRGRGHGVRVVAGVPAGWDRAGSGWDMADACVLHVDLTRTPPAYAAFANAHAVAINGRFPDNAKRVVSTGVVTPGDGHAGPVIVKSDLNYGGVPERVMARRTGSWLDKRAASVRGRLPWTMRPDLAAEDYRVFERRADVPGAVWRNPALVVERFVEERAEGMYWVRSWVFLGDRGFVRFLGSDHPVIKAERVKVRRVADDDDPAVLPPMVRARRAELGMDFGKIDFVVGERETAVIDANRTPNSRLTDPDARRAEALRVVDGLAAVLAGAGVGAA